MCTRSRPPPWSPGQQGRTPLKGKKLPTLAEIASTAIFTPVTITSPDGRERTAHIHEFVCLWYKPFYTRAVKVILIRNPGRTDGFDVALASTDTDVTASKLIARYDSRWTIETCNQEAKAHGVGQARNRVQKAVERTVPFGFLAQTITIIWYAVHGDPQADLDASPQSLPVVPPEKHRQLRRHARRATPRTDPQRVLGTSTPDDHHTGTHATPDTASLQGRLRSRKPRWFYDGSSDTPGWHPVAARSSLTGQTAPGLAAARCQVLIALHGGSDG